MPCECGCGQATSIAKQTRTAIGHVKGRPVRFIAGHQARGTKNPNYKTFEEKKRFSKGNGYVCVSIKHKHVLEHVAIAVRALGRPLPHGAEVHHINENRSDNRPQNLVICESREYHHGLHRRARAVRSGHPAHWRRCQYCKQFDDPANLYIRCHSVIHHACAYQRNIKKEIV